MKFGNLVEDLLFTNTNPDLDKYNIKQKDKRTHQLHTKSSGW